MMTKLDVARSFMNMAARTGYAETQALGDDIQADVNEIMRRF